MLTAPQKLLQKIIHQATGETLSTVTEIEDRRRELDEEDGLEDARPEVRGSGIETGLPCESSRHYEAKAVAAQMLDGSWVGWTYWYGGGKHGEPDAVEWIEYAYDVEVREVTKVVQEFSRKA